MKFTAEIRHTKESILQLSSIQYHAFRSGVYMLWSGCGVACIFGAVASNDQILFYILLLAGIWLLLNLELPAKHRADKIIQAGNGVLPHTKYSFREDNIHIASDSYEKTLAYKQLYALLEDKSYYYLFINRHAGFVVDKSKLSPANPDAFKTFLQQKTNLTFRRPAPVWNFLPSFSRKMHRK